MLQQPLIHRKTEAKTSNQPLPVVTMEVWEEIQSIWFLVWMSYCNRFHLMFQYLIPLIWILWFFYKKEDVEYLVGVVSNWDSPKVDSPNRLPCRPRVHPPLPPGQVHKLSNSKTALILNKILFYKAKALPKANYLCNNWPQDLQEVLFSPWLCPGQYLISKPRPRTVPATPSNSNLNCLWAVMEHLKSWQGDHLSQVSPQWVLYHLCQQVRAWCHHHHPQDHPREYPRVRPRLQRQLWQLPPRAFSTQVRTRNRLKFRTSLRLAFR